MEHAEDFGFGILDLGEQIRREDQRAFPGSDLFVHRRRRNDELVLISVIVVLARGQTGRVCGGDFHEGRLARCIGAGDRARERPKPVAPGLHGDELHGSASQVAPLGGGNGEGCIDIRCGESA